LVSKHTVDGVEYSYTYDSVGNITAVYKNGNLKYRYFYDALGQLTEAIIYSDNYDTDILADVYEYVYDKTGNITLVVHQYGESVSYGEGFNYTYSNSAWGDLLTSYNGTAITYDAIGNPLKWRNATAIEWQGRNLTMFSNSNGEIYNYAYNADGIRIAKTMHDAGGDYAGTTEYIYDGTKLIAENRNGTWLYYFYDANGTVTGMYYNNVLYYFRKNLQGDITGIYNATGTLVVEYEYTPYGAILSTTGSMATTLGAINPFRYRGYYYDIETGLYYVSIRYYDPDIGRWLNADSQLNTSLGILGINQFSYCLNTPVNMVDYGGNKPGDLFDTMDEAAKDFANYINGTSIEENCEYATYIYEVQIGTKTITKTYINPNVFGFTPLSWFWNAIFKSNVTKTVTYKVPIIKYTYKKPRKGSESGSSLPINWFGIHEVVAYAHTHGAYVQEYGSIYCDNFSSQDKMFAYKKGIIGYVATPLGLLRKYTPSNDMDIIISRNVPYDPNHPRKN